MIEKDKIVSITAKISEPDKRDFEDFCRNTGLNSSVAITMFIKYVNREKRIPFSINLLKDNFKKG